MLTAVFYSLEELIASDSPTPSTLLKKELKATRMGTDQIQQN